MDRRIDLLTPPADDRAVPVPAHAARALSPMATRVHRAMVRGFDRSGWRVEGGFPPDRKLVVVGAQHTSNWDFFLFVGAIAQVGREVHFMGKDSLFRWPMGDFMRGLGGVPVYRDQRRDMVQQMIEQFALRDDFILLIAAEGTRSPTDRWRTGFYRIAEAAGVRILCAAPDYPSRTVAFGPLVQPTGDYDADMAPTYPFFRSHVPRHPARGHVPDDPPARPVPGGVVPGDGAR